MPWGAGAPAWSGSGISEGGALTQGGAPLFLSSYLKTQAQPVMWHEGWECCHIAESQPFSRASECILESGPHHRRLRRLWRGSWQTLFWANPQACELFGSELEWASLRAPNSGAHSSETPVPPLLSSMEARRGEDPHSPGIQLEGSELNSSFGS